MSYSHSAADNKKCGFAQWLLAVILMTTTGLAAATIYNLPPSIGSGPFSSCALVRGTTSTYSCTDSVSIGNNDTVIFIPNLILQVNGNFSVGNNSAINGFWATISATGNIDVGNNLFSSVNFSAGGNFQAGNNAVVMGNISAGDDIAVGNNATINGNVNAGGNLSIGSGTITGSCTYETTNYVCRGSSATASFTVTPSTTTASSCSVAGGTPAAPWITITAKSGAGGNGVTVTGYTGTVTITGIGSGTLSKKTANGTLSGNRYTFSTADNGVALLYLTDPTVESVTPVASDGSASGASSSAITFSDNVLVISDADTLSPSYQPVAGRTHALNAAVWRKDANSGNCSVNTKINSTVASKIWMTTSAFPPSGTAAPAVSTSAACTGPVVLPTASPGSTNISLAFSNGVAPFYLCTTDVGQYQVNVASPALPGAASSGTSSTFTTVPFAIVVSDIQQGTTSNPGTLTASDTVFAKAGSAFQATVAAYKWNGAADTNNDGLPDDGALSTNVTSGGTVPGYAQTVTLAATTPISPSNGTTGSGLANGVVSVAGGSTTVNTLSYPEVGSFTLSAMPAANYFGVANLSNRVLIYSTKSTAPNKVVGRFTPDHLITELTQGCTAGGFTYSKQPFTLVLTAVNAAGTPTKNYDTGLGYANVTLSLIPSSPGTLLTPNVSFSAGTQTISEKLTMVPWTPQTQTTLHLADNVDAAITSSGHEGSTNFRIGRVRLMNASGSELLDLPMTMQVEYWKNATNGWVLNSDDSCTGNTAISASNAVTLATTNLTLPAAAFSAMCAYDAGAPGESEIGCPTPGTPANRFLNGSVAGFAGNFNLNFKKPGAGNAGDMTVTATVPTWLQYNWKSSTTAGNPTAKASFGKVKNSKVIFRREMY